MILMRMQQNLQIQDLAYRYNVSAIAVARAFTEIKDILFHNLKDAIYCLVVKSLHCQCQWFSGRIMVGKWLP